MLIHDTSLDMGNRNAKCKHDPCTNVGKYAFDADKQLGYVVCEDHKEDNMIRIICVEPKCENIAKYVIRDHPPETVCDHCNSRTQHPDPIIEASEATHCIDHLTKVANQCRYLVRCKSSDCLSKVCMYDYCKEHVNQVLFRRYTMYSPTEHSKCLVKDGIVWPITCHRKRHEPFNVCEWHISEAFFPTPKESDYSGEVWSD